ncbi:MAG: hypothetical protein ACLP5H_24515 [Desulfomonilaceae bacterium]
MNRILLLVTLAAFLAAGSLIFAKGDFMVNCCVSGQCSKMTAPACQRLKGRVVQDCGQCR